MNYCVPKKLLNKLFKKYPYSFTNNGRNVLKNAAKNEEKIDYNDLQYNLVVK